MSSTVLFGFPLVGHALAGEEPPVALIEPIVATACVAGGPVQDFEVNELHAFGYYEVTKLCARLLETSEFRELTCFVASTDGECLTGTRLEGFRPNFLGHSAQLAFLLALLATKLSFRTPSKASIKIWVTGALSEGRNGEPQLTDVDDFPHKLNAFAQSSSESRLFVCPEENWDSSIRQPDGTHVIRLGQQPLNLVFEAALESPGKHICLVSRDDLLLLITSLFNTRSLEGQINVWFTAAAHPISANLGTQRTSSTTGSRGMLRKARLSLLLLVSAIAVLIGGGSFRWFISSPCIPMDWQCFRSGIPTFAPSELGFLIEQRSFAPGADTSQMVKALAARFTDWRNEFGAAACTADANAKPQDLARVRVVAIPRVTDNEVRRSRAGLGIAGPLEYSGSPGEYYFHDTRAILNLAALTSSPNTSEFSTRAFQRIAFVRTTIDYAGDEITFSGGLTNAIRGATLPKSAMKPFFVLHAAHSANGMGLQNLNWSRGAELSLLEQQTSIENIPQVVDVISSSSLKPYATSLLKLRLVADKWLDSGTVHTNLHQTFAESPPIVRSLAHQLVGEGMLFSIHGYFNEATQSPLCAQSIDPEHIGRYAVYEWAAPIVEHYSEAANRRPCVSCRLTLAKLRHCAGDEDEVLNILDSTARDVRGLDAARLVHQAIKYAESTIARATNPPNQSARLAPKIRRWLDVLRETNHNTIADFEHGRWLLAWGNIDEAKERFADVLTRRPGHLLTRFLYSKALSASGGIPSAERVQILMSILEDLLRLQTDPTKDEDFQSLGPIDDVQHSINPTYVVEDLISAQVARCDPNADRTAQRARSLSHVDWGEIANTFQSGVRGYYAFPGIARWSSQSSLRCEDLQARIRHLFEIFATTEIQ